MPKIKETPYEQAKQVVDNLELGEQITLTTNSVDNFRKYLRELAQKVEKQFATRTFGSEITMKRKK